MKYDGYSLPYNITVSFGNSKPQNKEFHELENPYLKFIRNAVSNRAKNEKSRDVLGEKSYIDECLTVQMNAGRRTGKTTAAVNYLKENPKAVLIVTNCHFKQSICDQNPELEKRVFSTMMSFVKRYIDLNGDVSIGREYIEIKYGMLDAIIFDELYFQKLKPLHKFTVDLGTGTVEVPINLYEQIEKIAYKTNAVIVHLGKV